MEAVKKVIRPSPAFKKLFKRKHSICFFFFRNFRFSLSVSFRFYVTAQMFAYQHCAIVE